MPYEISDEDFAQVQKYAAPLIDKSVGDVIGRVTADNERLSDDNKLLSDENKLLIEEIKRLKEQLAALIEEKEEIAEEAEEAEEAFTSDEVQEERSAQSANSFLFDLSSHQNVTYTKPYWMKIGDELTTGRLTWVGIYKAVIKEISKKLGGDVSRTEDYIYTLEKSGTPDLELDYSYFSDLDISIQRRSAKSTWGYIAAACKELGIPIEIRFHWNGGAYAGKHGRVGIVFGPKENSLEGEDSNRYFQSQSLTSYR